MNHIIMKLILTLSLSLLLMTGLLAQEVTEQSVQFSLGHQNAFTMEHPGADKKTVIKNLENALKEFGKVKRNKKAKEWNCLGCEVPGMSGPTNVYFKIQEGKNLTTSHVCFDDGTKVISSENNPEAANRLKQDLTYVGYDITRAVISKELDNEENNLKDRNKDQKKLEKKNADLHKEIEKYQEKIAEAEKNIEKNLQEQEDMKMTIEKQGQVVEEVTNRLNSVGKN